MTPKSALFVAVNLRSNAALYFVSKQEKYWYKYKI